MAKDFFLTIELPVTGEFKDRGSKFLAFARQVSTEEACHAFLDSVKKEHPKARHHCYAYRLGLDGLVFRANDDGEPSGTAGRPILGQIDSHGLTNVMVVVVRYFGGTLLGTSGLIHAYKMSTAEALNQALVVERILEDRFAVEFDYAMLGDVMNAVKKLGVKVLRQDFSESAQIEISIRQSEAEATLQQLRSAVAKIPVEMAAELKELPGMKVRQLANA
jgi:uncharacterized YigZ family protein